LISRCVGTLLAVLIFFFRDGSGIAQGFGLSYSRSALRQNRMLLWFLAAA
jgi:hypothetical protein